VKLTFDRAQAESTAAEDVREARERCWPRVAHGVLVDGRARVATGSLACTQSHRDAADARPNQPFVSDQTTGAQEAL
jgi:hypothetical protein